MESAPTELICKELEDYHKSLQRVAAMYFALVMVILVGLGALFYQAPFEAKRVFLSPTIEAAQLIEDKSKVGADDKKPPTPRALVTEIQSEPVLALILAVTSKLVLAIAAFYLVRLLLNVVRYNVKLSNKYKAISLILKLRQADSTLTMSDLGSLFNIDGYDFMNDKVINSDLTSKLTKLLDDRFSDLKNLTGQSSGPAEASR